MSTTVFDATSTLTDNDGGGDTSTTLVTIIAAAAMGAASGNQMRVTINVDPTSSWGSSTVFVNGLYGGPAAETGDAYDFAATPTQFLFGGVGTLNWNGTTFSWTSDWATLPAPYDETKNWAFAISMHSAIGADIKLATDNDYANAGSVYKQSTGDPGDAATVNKTGYSTASQHLMFVSKVEVQSSTLPLILGDRALASGLGALDTECDAIYICSYQPTTYTQATSTYAVGVAALGVGACFAAPAGITGGRKTVSTEIVAGEVTANDTPVCWAAVDTVNQRLLASGPFTGSEPVSDGEIFTLASFAVQMTNA